MAEYELTDPTASFHLGSAEAEFVRVWRDRAEVRIGEFSGLVHPYFFRESLVAFRDGLLTLHRTLRGTATFSDLEDRIEIHVEATPGGHVEVKGVARGDDGNCGSCSRWINPS